MLYTIGYQGRSLVDLTAALLSANVDTVVDVRQLPLSRWRPSFSKTRLKAGLESADLRYEHVGRLGVPKPIRDRFRETGDINLLHAAYAAHVALHRPALKELEALAERTTVCLLCFERDARMCHRSYLAKKLSEGIPGDAEVEHIA